MEHLSWAQQPPLKARPLILTHGVMVWYRRADHLISVHLCVCVVASQVCDTYPSELFVPKSATPAIIVGSSRFRSRGRFPALSYFHQDTLVSETHTHTHTVRR